MMISMRIRDFYEFFFQSGFAVQGRELTQLQTILQNQVARFGDHMFKDGSKVLGGELTLDTEVKFLKLSSSDTASTFASGIINDTSSTVGAGTSKSTSYFCNQLCRFRCTNSYSQVSLWNRIFLQVLQFISKEQQQLQQDATSATGNASIVSINRGVYFVRWIFHVGITSNISS